MRIHTLLRPLLLGALSALPLLTLAAEPPAVPEQAVDPEVIRLDLRTPRYPSNDFEISAGYGIFGIRLYGASETTNYRLAYHLNEDFYIEAAVAETTMSSKRLNHPIPGDPGNTSNEEPLKSTLVSIGYKGLLPGEVYLFGNYGFLTEGYMFGGLGKTTFRGKDEKTVAFGAGSKLYLTNRIALKSEVRNTFLTVDYKGRRKSTMSGEATVGLAFLF
jgi:outer membrane beta-barrel protein